VTGADGGLLVQRCRACGRRQYPPGGICRRCHAIDCFDWTPAPQGGVVVAHTVVHATTYADREPPYTIAVVELEPGLRVLAEVEAQGDGDGHGRAAEPAAGTAVRMRVALRGGIQVPVFTVEDERGP
jgi:uncharacterized OB-fold protein